MKAFLGWIAENKGLFTGLCIGLVIAILLLSIGFLPTLLIVCCVAVGAFLVARKDIRDAIWYKIVSLFTKK